MVTPGPVSRLQSPSFVRSAPVSPLLPCTLLQMSKNIDLAQSDKVFTEIAAFVLLQ